MGGAGHSYEIVSRLTTGCLIGLDQDDAAIQAAKKRLAKYGDKVKIIRSNFSEIRTVLGSIQIDKVNGILLDLGYLHISWTHRREDFRTVWMHRLI